MSILTMQLKTGNKQRLEMDEGSSMEQKTWQVYTSGKINVFRLHLNESREGFWQTGWGRSYAELFLILMAISSQDPLLTLCIGYEQQLLMQQKYKL